MGELKAELRKRLEAGALDRARHEFADQVIEYATANATIDLPDVLVDQEVEVMHDELRSALARQGLDEATYLKVVDKTDADIHTEFRPQAEKRVKTLMVLSEIAKARGVEVPDKDIEGEIERARSRYANNPELIKYFESERGRNYIRSTFRRSRLVEQLVDEWLAAHPDFPRLPTSKTQTTVRRLPSPRRRPPLRSAPPIPPAFRRRKRHKRARSPVPDRETIRCSCRW